MIGSTGGTGPAALIVTADDLGLCAEVDAGILDLVRAGMVTAVAVLVNEPHRPDLSPFLAAGTSLGLHVNLSLGRPVAPAGEVPSLAGPDGCFAGGPTDTTSEVPLGRHGGRRETPVSRTARGSAGLARGWAMEEVRRELAAQVEAFRRLAGRDPAHLTSHKHLAEADPLLFEVFLDAAAGLRCPVRTRGDAARRRCRERGIATPDRFLGDVCRGGYWTEERLARELGRPAAGVTELMCHPGRAMAARPGIWYAEEREVERQGLLAAAATVTAGRWRGWSLVGFESLHPAGREGE